MSVHREVRGRGPAMIALHGWALHGGIWSGTGLDGLARVSFVDLPGHGHSPALAGAHTLSRLADAVDQEDGPPALWLGWSLGGLLALHVAARRPERVRGLVLVATNPCFVAREDWPHGQSPAVLHAFANSLQTDFRRTLLRFLALQVRGSESGDGRAVLTELRAALFARGEPDPGALRDGLEILARTDLREAALAVRCPVLAVLGERDTLAPAAMGKTLRARHPSWRVAVIPGAGHAPFLSHRQRFLDQVEAFVHELP